MKRIIDLSYKAARRLAIAILGGTVLLGGIIMVVTPGPAIVVIPIGLAILAMEFAWARLLLRRVRKKISAFNASGRAERADTHRVRSGGEL